VGGLAFGLNWFYITNWALAAVAFLGFALLATGVALALGSFIPSQPLALLWTLPVILFLVIPPLFYMEPSLKAGLRAVMTWLPTPALVSLYRFASSSGASPAQVWQNLAVVLVSIGVVFSLVIWQVRRADR
jgi:ABC-type polysaccharide/polyol phosphate export permease